MVQGRALGVRRHHAIQLPHPGSRSARSPASYGTSSTSGATNGAPTTWPSTGISCTATCRPRIANSPEWPHHVPASWQADTADLDHPRFRFPLRGPLPRPASTWCSGRRPPGGHLSALGLPEIPAGDRGDGGYLPRRLPGGGPRPHPGQQQSPEGRWPLGTRYVYTDFDGNRIQLSARYNGERERHRPGRSRRPPADSAHAGRALPFRFPWVGQDQAPTAAGQGLLAGLRGALGLGKPSPPHFQVDAYSPWRGRWPCPTATVTCTCITPPPGAIASRISANGGIHAGKSTTRTRRRTSGVPGWSDPGAALPPASASPVPGEPRVHSCSPSMRSAL